MKLRLMTKKRNVHYWRRGKSDVKENTDIANEKDDMLMNDKENLSTIEENKEKYDSLNNNIESTVSDERQNSEIEERESSESEERVSSHGRHIRENAGSGV